MLQARRAIQAALWRGLSHPVFCQPSTRTAAASISSRSFSSVPQDNISGEATSFVEQLHARWQENPGSVDRSWQLYFESGEAPPGSSAPQAGKRGASDLSSVLHLIRAFQVRGHELAETDPLRLKETPYLHQLDYKDYSFTDADLDRPLHLEGFAMESISGLCSVVDAEDGTVDGHITLRGLLGFLKRVYCGTIGWEYMHIPDRDKCNWLRSYIEVNEVPVTKDEQRTVLNRLAFAHQFEEFLAVKFPTAKRFGLEGCESMVPGMKACIDKATEKGVEHVVLGMAHRGRLNVMANVIRKPLETIFAEFHGTSVPQGEDGFGSGDVKYHLGTSLDRVYPDGRAVHISLLPNPSHLEAVNPVVAGKARAKMQYIGDDSGHKVLPVIIHGDAAVAGQGVVYEQIQMARLPNYRTGGTLHIVCNNQVGFTTNPSSTRSTTYASDIAKAFDAPIFHVNADDPEAVCRAFQLAAMWRQEWHEDVWIDLIGYRLHGHNEMDQPRFTQPVMYQKVDAHTRCLPIYLEKLRKDGFTTEEIDAVVNDTKAIIDAAYDTSRSGDVANKEDWMDGNWSGYAKPNERLQKLPTKVDLSVLHTVRDGLTSLPKGFELHSLVKRTLKARNKALTDGTGIDWGTAEALAFGSLLLQGYHVRLSGEDVERGTFSHRHAVLHDQKTGERYEPINQVQGKQATAVITNSPLSEFGVVGFEFGYSIENPKALVIWEAQFGDFVNGAQIIIDQFLCAGEAKWLRQSGLVMLLPHGYDGAGPEHSSCRIERFLQSCDEDPDIVPSAGIEAQSQAINWQIVNCTTPGNYFHLLRRQVTRRFRKPLIVAAPKALLRLRACSSDFSEMTEGRFRRMIGEVQSDVLVDDKKIRRVVMCSGKIYYELAAKREELGVKDVAIVRLEQIAPFPFDNAAEIMTRYANAELVWCQEEPKNMGCWYYVQDRLMTATREINKRELRPAYVGRGTMASPAEGYGKVAQAQQQRIIEKALSTEHDTFFGHGAVA